MSLKGKEALHMYQIGIDIGGTNVKIGLLDESLELTAEASIPFPHTTAVDMAKKIRAAVLALLEERNGVTLLNPGTAGRLGRSSYFCRAAGLNMMKLLTNDVVYGKREDCVYNHTVALWQNVPTGILRRYVKDQELSDELKQFKGTHTLFCKGDLPLSRLYRLLRYYAAQYHNFRDYYFDKK